MIDKMNERSTDSGDEGLAVLRIIDANANRATEGLRVVEEYVRFHLDDQHLCRLCKQLRHDLIAALRSTPAADRLAARETQRDVGTQVAARSEYERDGLADVVRASFGRVEQSMRCIEEYSKVLSPELATEIEPLRYRAYTLERAIDTAARSRSALAGVRLYVLIDGRTSVEELVDLVGKLAESGVDAIQLRDKALDDRKLVHRARLLRELTSDSHTLFIVNDRPDVAVLADADGVHVGQEDVSVKDARKIVGTARLVGVSTHSLQQARQAVVDGADYIGCGPTFPSATKEFESFAGLDLLRAVGREISLPAFAIGGISRHNVQEVIAAGFTRVAISGSVVNADNPAAEAASLLEELNRKAPHLVT
jgi:thiamine-phosphate pyrophosphorylase